MNFWGEFTVNLQCMLPFLILWSENYKFSSVCATSSEDMRARGQAASIQPQLQATAQEQVEELCNSMHETCHLDLRGCSAVRCCGPEDRVARQRPWVSSRTRSGKVHPYFRVICRELSLFGCPKLLLGRLREELAAPYENLLNTMFFIFWPGEDEDQRT